MYNLILRLFTGCSTSLDMTNNSGANPATTPTNYPCYGIWLERVNSIAIGRRSKLATVDGSPNFFLNFGQNNEPGVWTQGIRSIISNVKIVNSVFRNFGKWDFIETIKSDAVFAWNNQTSTITTTEFRGMNELSGGPEAFNYCVYDIRTEGTHLMATEYTSNYSVFSIDSDRYFSSALTTPQPSISYNIKNNIIRNFRFTAIRLGIHLDGNINVEGNEISDIDDPLEVLSPRIGVFLEKVNMGLLELSGAYVRNNIIRSSSEFPNGVFFGIALRKTSKVTISSNNIVETLPNPNVRRFEGIRVELAPCNELNLAYNTISGGRINYPDGGFGIYLEESPDCTLSCNSVDNTNVGIQINGKCDMFNKLYRNSFNYHGVGLALGDDNHTISSIEEQIGMENRWFGASSLVEARAIKKEVAEDSKFMINSSDQGSDYWPLPRKIGTDDDNNMTWFDVLPNQEPSTTADCLVRKTDLSDRDIRLLDGTYSSPFGYPALDWEDKWQFANRLNSDPELRSFTPVVTHYYEQTYDESFSRLSRVYQAYLKRWSTPSIIEELTTTQAASVEARFALEDLLADGSNVGAIQAQMLDIDASIVTNATAFSTAFEAWSGNVNESMENLLTEVESIPCSEQYDEDMRSVLSILIRSDATGEYPTEREVDIIKQIAHKCRYSGGYAVVLARSFFEPEEVYEQDLVCNSEERGGVQTQILKGGVTLSPNPASHSVTLGIAIPFKQGSVKLVNGQGELVKELIVNDRFITIPLESLSSGIYQAVVSLDGSIYGYKSFIKI